MCMGEETWRCLDSNENEARNLKVGVGGWEDHGGRLGEPGFGWVVLLLECD